MTYDKMNSYILEYINNDITGRAIMLDGSWGSGKSYYIKNHLKPFLEKQENGNHKCVIVSLYGIKEISELSKAIYVELRSIGKSISSEGVNTAAVVGKIVGKTFFNGLISKIGFDIGSISDDDLQKVYESIDLTGKLIVLEDIERTKIDIEELLGYINNLCENDNVKVLLVANESEIIQYRIITETISRGGKELQSEKKVFTEKTKRYLDAKEKTVSDTIHFQCDYITTIQDILQSFGYSLIKYNNPEGAVDISELFLLLQSDNLRAFIYGCQKCKMLFEYIEKNNILIKDDIRDIIFYGIIAYTQRQSFSGKLSFGRDSYLSPELGLNEHIPLFRFCYDFIEYQSCSKEKIETTIAYYENYRMIGKWNTGRDSDLKVIKNFYTSTEKEVADSIMNLPEKLRKGDIPYYDYGVLLNYLVAIKYDAEIDFNIDPVESSILSKLKESDQEIEYEELFSSGYGLKNQIGIDKFNEIKQNIRNALNISRVSEFPYEGEKIKEFYEQNEKKISENLTIIGFVHKLNIEKFIEMLKHCTADQIYTINGLFRLYKDKRKEDVLGDDIHALNDLSDKIAILLNYHEYDKIQKLQIKWLVENISEIVISFSN